MDAVSGEEAEKQPPFSLLNLSMKFQSSLESCLEQCVHKSYSISSFLLEMTAFCTRQHCSHCISTKYRKMWLSNTVADHLLTPFVLYPQPPPTTTTTTCRYVSRVLLCCISYNFIMQPKKNSHLVCNSLLVICTCLDSNYEVVRASACGLQMRITPYIKARRNTFKLRLYFLAFHIFILSFFFPANVIAAVNLLQTRSVFRLCKCIQFNSTIIARCKTFLSNWGSGNVAGAL